MATSLNILQGIRSDLEPSEEFDAKVRAAAASAPGRGLSYWTPAFIGAAVAALALLSVLQIATRTAENAHNRPVYGEARKLRAMPMPMNEVPTLESTPKAP